MKKTCKTELIGLYDVSRIFGRSMDAMRKYRSLGLIEPCKIAGRKHLYKKEDIIITKHFIDAYQKEGKTLSEIAKVLQTPEEELDFATKNIKPKIYRIQE